jgi:hypothetical protein
METNTRASEKAAAVKEASAKEASPKDRRIPLRIVAFTMPTAIPGLGAMVTVVEVGEHRLMGGKPYICPRPFLDPVTRTIWIEGREFPLERVHYWERDKTGFEPKSKELPDHTIGKRAYPSLEP